MAHQIVATSVPRGLDGVSGYQTVLKSVGIPPRVFDRLKARSGYSHRYPHGDSRNPVIYVHRIEELGGSRWHVLGCIRDAGSDHTGRSNFLAHMLAIDAAEARGKPAGPAAAAIARGCFLESWNRPPDPAAPAKTLVAADRPTQPGETPAWTAAGLDPGLAGDLAAAAMAGQKAILVTRPDDDVLALFADSLRLVEPSRRWSVTFNTCAIEDFDGVWKAIRADLGDTRDLRDGKASLIDLTKNPRGSTNPYAQFARGESTVLPWHKPVASVRTEQEIPELSNKAAPQTAEAIVPRGDPRKVPPKHSGRVATRGNRDRRPRYEEADAPRFPWHAIAVGAFSLLAVSGLVAIPYREQILDLVGTPTPRPIKPDTELSTVAPVNPSPIDVRDTPEYRAAQKLKDARDRLAAGVEGKTHGILRAEADDLLKHVEDLRGGKGGEAPLKVMAQDGPDRDPKLGLQEVVGVCDRVLEVLEKPTGELKLEEVLDAESRFKSAVAKLDSLRNQVDRLAFDERETLNAERMAKQAEDDRKRRQQAFVQFQSMSKAVDLPIATSRTDVGLDDADHTEAEGVGTVDLGTFSFADLVGPKFALALPHGTVDGNEFRADIVKDGGEGQSRWNIRYIPLTVGVNADQAKPRMLAHLVAREGRLFLDIPRSNELALQPFAMFRRSVILVEAKDPNAPDAAAIVQEIRLVKPTHIKPLKIDLLSERQQQLRLSTHKLPGNSVQFEASFPNGKTETLRFTGKDKENASLGIKEWPPLLLATIPLSKLNDKQNGDLEIQAIIKLSLPQATMTVDAQFGGALAKAYRMSDVREFFIDAPDATLKRHNKSFDAIAHKGETFKFGLDPTWQASVGKQIKDWFGTELVGERARVRGIVMPGHETIKSSFEMFLKETGPARRNTFDDFEADCRQVRGEEQWKTVFLDRVDAWSKWFWPQFKKQWHEHVRLFRGALDEPHTLTVTAISGLAYDENDKEYLVPLVISDVPATVDRADMHTETQPTPEPADSPVSADDSAVPTSKSTEKSSVGIE